MSAVLPDLETVRQEIDIVVRAGRRTITANTFSRWTICPKDLIVWHHIGWITRWILDKPAGVATTVNGDVLEGVAYKAFNLVNDRVGIQSSGVLIGQAETLNFVGTGNTFAVNGSTIDVSISGGGGSGVMVVGVRVGTAVTFAIPTTNTLDVVGRSATVNVPV